jgi:hypothetical protein
MTRTIPNSARDVFARDVFVANAVVMRMAPKNAQNSPKMKYWSIESNELPPYS